MRSNRTYLLLAMALTLSIGACTKKSDDTEKSKTMGPAMVSPLPVSQDLPAEVMGLLVIKTPAATFAQMEKLSGLVGPVPPGALNGLVFQGLLQLGFKDTSVVDLQEPAGLLLANPKNFPMPVLLALSVSSKEKLLAAMQPAWQLKDPTDGVHQLSQPTRNLSVYLKFSGKTVFAAMDAKLLEIGMPVLAKSLSAGNANLQASLRVDHLRRVYQAELTAMPQMLKQQAKRGMNQGVIKPGQKKIIDWVLDLSIDKMFAFVEQTQEVNISANINADVAQFQMGLRPEQDSFFAKFLAAQKHQPLKLAALMPSDHFLVMGVNVQWDLVKQDFLDLTDEMMKILLDDSNESEMKATIKEFIPLLKEFYAILGDEIAVAENISDQGIELIEAFAITDEKRAREIFTKMFEKSLALLEKVGDVIGMKFGPGGMKEIGQHRGISILSFSFSPEMPSLDPAQAKMFKFMYGEQMKMYLAFFDKQAVLTMGKNGEQLIKDAIDRARGKGQPFTVGQAYAGAAGPLAKDTGGFLFMSISQMMQLGITMGAAVTGKDNSPTLPKSESGLFWGFRSTPEQVVTTLRMPAAHLREIGQGVKAITALNQ